MVRLWDESGGTRWYSGEAETRTTLVYRGAEIVHIAPGEWEVWWLPGMTAMSGRLGVARSINEGKAMVDREIERGW
jgi:hypothetical protein